MDGPRNLKHYEILSRLGEGGMGVVYRARDTRLGRIVALKLLPAELGRSQDRSQRFEREARIVSGLSHPGIATLYDFDREGETAFLTMELVSGSTLRQLLERGPLPQADLLECGVQVADALAAAHRAGVVHRDLKPENIMASDSGYYKVLDFGVARIDEVLSNTTPSTRTPTRTWATQAGSLVGTVAYMSPEQVLGRRADARSDIFAMGSVLYELATGRPAFSGTSDIAVAHAIAYEPHAGAATPLPAGLELILAKCLAKNPDERYKSAEELAGDLRLLRAHSQSGTISLRQLVAQPARRGRVRRAVWIGGGVFALTSALVLAGWWVLPGAREEKPTVPASAPASAAIPVTSARGTGAVAGAVMTKPRLVVAAFDNPGADPAVEPISRGLPQMLTTDLSRSPGLEVIATERLHDLLAAAGRDPSAGLDRSTTAELARWAGADLVVSGSVFSSRGRYRIDAQAYDTNTGTVVAARKAEGNEPFALVNELTAGLLEALEVAGTGGGAIHASPEAFREFSRGKELYDQLAFSEAAEAFGTALELDPTFDLARLNLALSWLADGDVEDARPLLLELAQSAVNLPEAEKLLGEALTAYYAQNDAARGDARFEVLVERFPARSEARLWWAHALEDIGGKRLRAVKQLREALEVDPGSVQAVVSLAEHLSEVGSVDEARRLLLEAAERNPRARITLERVGIVEDPGL